MLPHDDRLNAPARDTVPIVGGVLLHPIPLISMLLWGMNDRTWKYTHTSWITGKLSDVCGLIVFPLLGWSLMQAVWKVRGERPTPPRSVAYAVVIATGVVFSAINVSEAAGDVYRSSAQALAEPLHRFAVAIGAPTLFTARAQHTVDAMDLVTLPALFVAWALIRRDL